MKEVGMEQIYDNIYVETQFLGCNPSFVVTSEGVVMIDTPQKPTDAIKWREEITKKGEIRYIINTDHHLDHTVGNYFFSGIVISHQKTREKLLSPGLRQRILDRVKLMDPSGLPLMDRYESKIPTITFNNCLNLYLGGYKFELIHLVGHTTNSIAIYMPHEKVVFTGDNVSTIGLPSLKDSSPVQWMQTLEIIQKMDVNTVVPGHGPLGDKTSVPKFFGELEELIREIQEAIDQGLNKEEIVKKITYTDLVHSGYPREMNKQFIQSMQMSIVRVYEDLESQRLQRTKNTLRKYHQSV
jgi:cyclase